jgi:hypothetical protein
LRVGGGHGRASCVSFSLHGQTLGFTSVLSPENTLSIVLTILVSNGRLSSFKPNNRPSGTRNVEKTKDKNMKRWNILNSKGTLVGAVDADTSEEALKKSWGFDKTTAVCVGEVVDEPEPVFTPKMALDFEDQMNREGFNDAEPSDGI